MSSSRFALFSNKGRSLSGEAATVALHDYLLAKPGEVRLLPKRVASQLGLDEDLVQDLLDAATDPRIGLLEEVKQVRCPDCGGRIDLEPLVSQRDAEGVALCPDCEHEVHDLDKLTVERRYRLSTQAAAEARDWQATQASRPAMRAVVLTALVEELAAVREQMTQAGKAPVRRVVPNGGLYYEAHFAGEHVDWTVYATFTQASTAAAAAGAVEAIANFSPNILMYVGIAGGIKNVALGDVVAATEVLDYDGGKETPSGFVPRPQMLQATFPLSQLAAMTIIEDGWRNRIASTVEGLDLPAPVAHAEPIAAGSKVVASRHSETYALVRRTADRAVAIEMEGSGFLSATQRYGNVDRIVVRGISDLIDEKGAADRAGVRTQAVANAAAFAFAMLATLTPPDPSD